MATSLHYANPKVEEGKIAAPKPLTGVMADAVDMILKEGQITSLGDDSQFTMAALDTQFFERLDIAALETLCKRQNVCPTHRNVLFEPPTSPRGDAQQLIIVDYFSTPSSLAN